MAAPHVAGAWAILKSAGTTDGSVDDILNYLEDNGVPITDPRNNITKPRINLSALAPSSISGQVTDADGNPIPNVTITTDKNQITTTDASGNYIFNDLLASTYTFTPTKQGYIFSPASLTVTVPPDAVNQNFTGQGSAITVEACSDQDADGTCGPGDPLPTGAMGCLSGATSGDLGCLPAPALFDGLDPNETYTPYLQFSGDSQGYYPTARPQSLQVAPGESAEVTLGAVQPVYPKGVTVDAQRNKVYAAFRGPKIDDDYPYPFVAVIDGETDEALYTIGGAQGVGRKPWGVVVSGDFLYVGSTGDKQVSIFNANDDTLITTHPLGPDFKPSVPVVNPTNGRVQFVSYKDGREVIFNGTDVRYDFKVEAKWGDYLVFTPFEQAVANDGRRGYTFVAMRDAQRGGDPNFPFKIAGFSSSEPRNIKYNDMNPPGGTGSPHALGLWQEGGESRLFITYSDDPRTHWGESGYQVNPNKIAVYAFSTDNPENIWFVREEDMSVKNGINYAEAGLVHNPMTGQMLGTYGGYPFWLDECNTSQQGGVYSSDWNGSVSPGPAPAKVIGSPASAGSDLQWRNPFEIAVNPLSGKVYVTDRCWNGVGGVLTFDGSAAVPAASTAPAIPSAPAPAPVPAISGDVTRDGAVNIFDLAFIAARFNTSDLGADLNGDGVVDIFDLSIAAGNYR